MIRKIIFIFSFTLVFLVTKVYAQWQQDSLFYGNKVNCFVNQGENIYAGTQKTGAWASQDGGLSWNQINNGLPTSSIRSLTIDGTKIIAGTSSGDVYSSHDNGKHWNKLGSGLPYPVMDIYSLAVSEASIFAAVRWHGVFRLHKGDSVWTQCVNGMPINTTVQCLAVKEERIFAGTHREGIFFSDDNGVSWNPAIGLPLNATIGSIAPIGENIFAGSYWQGLFVSSDNGAYWTKVASISPITNLSVGSIAVSNDNIFVGTYSHGIVVSSDRGVNWVDISDGLPLTAYNFSVVALNINNGRIIAGAETYFPSVAEGLWQSPLSSLLSAREDDAPSNFFLDQNYPNPFNPTTTISYSLPFSGFALLKVYNILGEEIITLVSEYQEKGIHQIKFDGSQLGSGNYIYRITIGKFAKAKKMVILK